MEIKHLYSKKTKKISVSRLLMSLTLYLIETPLRSFANRADPDQAALVTKTSKHGDKTEVLKEDEENLGK